MTNNSANRANAQADLDRPEVAFEAMTHKLAALVAAVEGFAARQQELHSRDYTEDLARIHACQDDAAAALETLASSPALQLTPEAIAGQIYHATARASEVERQHFGAARIDLDRTVLTINDIVQSILRGLQQLRWLGVAAAIGVVTGFLLGWVVPDVVDRAVPEGWHWPEERAASLLQRDGWATGERMLQVSDPQRWQALREAASVWASNVKALEACQQRAAKAGKGVNCSILVGGPQR
ncbi:MULTISPECIES: DUF6118 family protein [unclassified Novosphingobium]|uniref:DUF6118 family protein n=1 Tax=unclassified Novosphingobium TaxID=2644732 RepID=UPI00144279B1|nr:MULTISPECIES: DUF6118 family protein [unclassified Novosphingobium]MBB3360472.1 hypothetical protein [Novosphingobium sp. BK256]MBB3376854.1 hypothetical protein [Novosphingobium sp. BK280]MBB3381224.1 hypothetical protein [Novosphingobium sp. BK258]MBB3422903.1 hypothetical protein [Novosphingobium sp. BK267]MBB3451605.1 hypothetical protein [Novosphingobium sp. BK352]